MNALSVDHNWPDRLPWLLRPFAWFVLCVVTLPFGLVTLSWICIRSTMGNFWHEREFTKQMRLRGRMLSLSQLADRLRPNSQQGTLLIETPFPSWAVTRAWWCEEEIHDHTPYEQIFEQYLDPINGSAFLVRAWNGKTVKHQIQRDFCHVKIVSMVASPDWCVSQTDLIES